MDNFMRKETLITVASITLLVVALVFALLGFMQAPNSQVAPGAVAAFMLISAAAFAGLAVLGLRGERVWQRFLGVAAVTGALYMVVMALLFFNALSAVQLNF